MSEGAFRNRVWRYRLATAGTVAFCLLVVGFALWRSGTFEECLHKIPYEEATKQYGGGLPLLLFLIGEWLGCLGPFIDSNADPIIAVFTLILAIATIRLWISTNRLWEGAERSSERQLRAYVSCSMTFIGSFDEESLSHFKFIIANVGQTPAFNVRHQGSIDVLEYPYAVNPILSPLTAKKSDPHALFPSQNLTGTARAQRLFTEAEIKAIRAGTKRIMVYGVVTYNDAFGIRRSTKFCYGITGEPDMLYKLTSFYKPADLQVTFEIAPMGNDAD